MKQEIVYYFTISSNSGVNCGEIFKTNVEILYHSVTKDAVFKTLNEFNIHICTQRKNEH